jgi:hypothetical protein
MRSETKRKKKDMELIVEKKSVYGNQLIYPVCNKAKLFASISGNKTLLPEVIEDIKKLGYKLNNKGGTNMKTYQGWEIESPQSNAGRWSVILNHKHSHRTHFIDLESSMTLRSVEDLIYTTIEKLIEEETNK